MKMFKISKNTKQIKEFWKLVLQWFEISLGMIVLFVVLVVTAYQVFQFGGLNWDDMNVFIEILKIVLQLAIGIEVARLLFSYNLNTMIELAVFIVARKMLLTEGDALSLLLEVSALVLLFAARHFFMEDDRKTDII